MYKTSCKAMVTIKQTLSNSIYLLMTIINSKDSNFCYFLPQKLSSHKKEWITIREHKLLPI